MSNTHRPFLGLDVSHKSQAAAFLAIALLVLGAALLCAVFNAYSALYDDAFIYLRYARNIAEGCGPTFNCGTAAVEGFTSPLYQSLLVIGHLLTTDGETLLTTLGLVGGWIALVFTSTVSAHFADDNHRLRIALVTSAVLVLALDSFVVLQMFTGMETWLAWLFSALLAHATLSRRYYLVVGIVAAAPLVRPEYAAFLPLLFIFEDFRRLKPWLAISGFLALMTLTRLALFGELLPNTFFVKQGGSTVHALLGVDYLVDTVQEYPALLIAPLALVEKRHRQETAFLLGGSAIWFAYQLRSGGDFYPHSRMLMPLIPMLTVLAIGGLSSTLGVLRPIDNRGLHVWPKSLGPILVVIGSCALYWFTPDRIVHIPPERTRTDVWRAAGEWAQAELPKNASVATVAIGAIGYYGQRTVIDLVGIVDPEIGRHVPERTSGYPPIGHETYNTEEVLQRSPEVIILLQPLPYRASPPSKAIVGTPAETDLLETIVARDGGYRVIYPEILPGVSLCVLVDSELYLNRLQKYDAVAPEALEVDYRTPDDWYPNLPID